MFSFCRNHLLSPPAPPLFWEFPSSVNPLQTESRRSHYSQSDSINRVPPPSLQEDINHFNCQPVLHPSFCRNLSFLVSSEHTVEIKPSLLQASSFFAHLSPLKDHSSIYLITVIRIQQELSIGQVLNAASCGDGVLFGISDQISVCSRNVHNVSGHG